MKLPKMLGSWDLSNKTSFALAVSNVVLVVLLAAEMLHANSIKEDIVMTPPRVDETMRVGWDSANEAYVKSWGLYVATLVSNVTANNAQLVVDDLSQFMDSGAYSKTRLAILAAAETRTFKEAAGATKFEPTGLLYEPSTQKVFVSGNYILLTSAGGQSVRAITYEMVVRIVARRPVVYSLESYDGITPHTEQWIKDHQPLEEAKQ